RMRVERTAGEANISGTGVAVTLHQITAAAHDADRKTAAQRLAVSDEVGADAKIFLGAAFGEPKADEDLVKDQNNVALAADRAQLFQPFAVVRFVEVGAAPAVDERGVARRTEIRMQRLQGIDQNTGDVAALAQHAQCTLGHFGERVGPPRRYRIANP